MRFRFRSIAVVLAVVAVVLAGCESDETDTSGDSSEEQTEEQSEDATGSQSAGNADDEESDDNGDDSGEESASDEDGSDTDSSDDDDDSESEEESGDSDGEEGDGESEEDSGGDETALEGPQTVDSFDELPIHATGPVATIDGEEVTADEFNAVAERQLMGVNDQVVQNQGQQLEQMLLEGVVIAYLLDREVERRDIEVESSEIDRALEEFNQMMEAQAGDQLGQMQALMEQQGIDEQVLREQAERQLAIEELVGESRDLSVSDQDVRDFYDRNAAHLQQEDEQVRARHILLNVDDSVDGQEEEKRQQIEELAEQLQNGDADFAELAREHSDGPSADSGGDLGYFTREQFMPEFTEAAFEMEPGEISEPVRSDLGWHVIRVEDRREDGSVPFEEMRETIRLRLEAQRFQQALTQFAAGLRDDSEIETREDNIVVQ